MCEKKRRSGLVLLLCLLLMSSPLSAADRSPRLKGPFSEADTEALSGADKRTMETLFVLSTDIAYADLELERIQEEIVALEKQIDLQSLAIRNAEADEADLRMTIKTFLNRQQKSRGTAVLEAFFDSKDIGEFMMRVEWIKEIAHQMKQLKQAYAETRNQLVADRSLQKALLESAQDRERAFVRMTAEKRESVAALRAHLESLGERRTQYEAYLHILEGIWGELTPLFSKTVTAFIERIESGDFPDDTVQMKTDLSGVKGILYESTFNRMLDQRADLEPIHFDFKPSGVYLSFPDYRVRLFGAFEIVDGQTLIYQVEKGYFVGLPLGEGALEALFSEVPLQFNLRGLIGANEIRKSVSFEDRMELDVIIKLF